MARDIDAALTGQPVEHTLLETCAREHERNTAMALDFMDQEGDEWRAQVHATLAQAWAARMIAERRS